jgi:hypothetical protein
MKETTFILALPSHIYVFVNINFLLKLDVVVHTCNLSTEEAEAGGLQVQGQPGLYNKTLSLKKIISASKFTIKNATYLWFSRICIRNGHSHVSLWSKLSGSQSL